MVNCRSPFLSRTPTEPFTVSAALFSFT
jgi:hypothetical protein